MNSAESDTIAVMVFRAFQLVQVDDAIAEGDN